MRSFGLIEKYECPHHRVLTQETPPRTNDEILLSSKKLYASTTSHNPRTSPLLPRETPLFRRIHTASERCPPSQIAPQIPRFPGIFVLPQRHLPKLDFPVQVNPAQINKILIYYRILSVKLQKIGFIPLWSYGHAYNLPPESTTYDCKPTLPSCIIKAPIVRAKAGARA